MSKFKNFPTNKYEVIYADPPYDYGNMKGLTQGVFGHYETLTKKEICSVPVSDIKADNCVLFMWITCPWLMAAQEIMEAWGFKYKTVAFCWVKKTKHGKWAVNLGGWTMGNVELCLLGTFGRPKRIVKNIRQLVIEERTVHSRKPDDVRNRIVELMGDVPKIELFAREKSDGWDSWGNEI